MGIGGLAECLLESLPVFGDGGDFGHCGLYAGLGHFTGIGNRKPGLLLKSFSPPVPELGLIEEGVEDGRGIALTHPAPDTHRGSPAVGKGTVRIMAGGAGYSIVDRQARVEKEFLAEGDFFGGLRIVCGYFRQALLDRNANLFERSGSGQRTRNRTGESFPDGVSMVPADAAFSLTALPAASRNQPKPR